jgi:transcriptional antiterminator RfaH
MFGEHPVPIADTLVAAIARRIVEVSVEAAFRPGRCVETVEGPFRDLDDIFAARREDERVVLPIERLHRRLRMTVPTGSVKRRLVSGAE